MAENWTAEQKQVIDLRNRSLLVSAAAGSGKTAVLVERILSIVCDKKRPVDIDRLLVVTFTNAAAAQMRERIRKALEDRMTTEPDSRYLSRQLTLLGQAKIQTIDSFCLSVLREQFHQIPLDPSFRIGDQGELKLLKEDVLSTLLEKKHSEKEEAFLKLWDTRTKVKNERTIEGLILDICDIAVSHPRPLKWIETCKKACSFASFSDMEKSGWMQELFVMFRREIRYAVEEYDRLTALCTPEMEEYTAAFQAEKREAERLLQAEGYEEIRTLLRDFHFVKQKPRFRKDSLYDKDYAAALWERRNAVKKNIIESYQKEYFPDAPDFVIRKQKLAGESAACLLELSAEFLTAYRQAKEERSILDFGDMEHLVLELFSKEKDGEEEPTEIAREYAARFEEIMIDEYQDSNYVQEVILKSISREGSREPNLFMVGDVKQSIYRFRLARPDLFMHKYETFTREESSHQKIELHKNFRSRDSVLEPINYLFRRIMRKDLGNIEYDNRAALYPEKSIYEETCENVGGPVRLLLMDSKEEEGKERTEEAAKEEGELQAGAEERADSPAAALENEISSKEWEALMIADEIKRLTDPVSGKKVWDKEQKCYRTAQYRDIAILFRALGEWGDTCIRVLTEKGIPAAAESGTGYFSAREVRTVMNLLQIINNPMQDIPLAGVLLSPIADFSEEELARIRIGTRGMGEFDLYGAMNAYRTWYGQEALGEKAEAFFQKLEQYREKSTYLPIHELIRYCMEDSGYYQYVSSLPGGERRRANLDMLEEKALQFEKTSYTGVFSFVRYLEKLEKYEIDFPEAQEKEGSNLVRILTIHKSKGLEYPIVIAGGLGKKHNRQDSRRSVVLHADYGIAMDAIDGDRRSKGDTIMKKVLAKKIDQENLGEELRVLYVAMTRARELLVLTGTAGELDQWLTQKLLGGGRELSWKERSSSSCCLDWIVGALAGHSCFNSVRRQLRLEPVEGEGEADAQFEVRLVQKAELLVKEAAGRLDAAWYRKKMEESLQEAADPQKERFIRERLQYPYRSSDAYRLYTSVSVSDLKKKQAEQEEREGEEELYGGRDAESVRPDARIASGQETGSGRETGTGQETRSGQENRSGRETGVDQGIGFDRKTEENQGFEAYADSGSGEDLDWDPGEALNEDPSDPLFLSGERRLSAAERGTLYHYIFEHLDPCRELSLSSQYAGLKEKGILTKAGEKAVNFREILAFYETELGKRCIEARKRGDYHAESPFCMGIPAKTVFPQLLLEEDTRIKVHGIIDAWFEEDGKIILLDYKTDSIRQDNWEGELVSRHGIQMNYYKEALERLTGKRVTEMYLYSIPGRKAIRL